MRTEQSFACQTAESCLPLVCAVFYIFYAKMAIFLPFISVAGILGDLSASIVKRQCLIKDFGNIMPGHGGVLDRFDSVLFTIPITYYIVKYVELAFLG